MCVRIKTLVFYGRRRKSRGTLWYISNLVALWESMSSRQGHLEMGLEQHPGQER